MTHKQVDDNPIQCALYMDYLETEEGAIKVYIAHDLRFGRICIGTTKDQAMDKVVARVEAIRAKMLELGEVA